MRITRKALTFHVVFERGAMGRGHFYSVWRHNSASGEKLILDVHRDYAVALKMRAEFMRRARA